jgi:protein-L-isoaspartate(D-aspartate) O-methyltransferase
MMSAANDDLVSRVARGARTYLDGEPRSSRVLEAMRNVDRADYLPERWKARAYDDEALPLGAGQTCSQPSMVAFMLDKLDIRAGMRVLEVGAGSGYAASVAARLCLPGGEIIACEILPELALRCRSNVAGLTDAIRVLEADGSLGLPELAPYDRIFLSAGVASSGFDEGPFVECLKPEGVLLYPEANGSLRRVMLTKPGTIQRDSWYGVSFVPLRIGPRRDR